MTLDILLALVAEREDAEDFTVTVYDSEQLDKPISIARTELVEWVDENNEGSKEIRLII